MTTAAPASTTYGLAPVQPVALVDLLDRVLATGVVVSGELTLSIADVDLVHISLRALISSARAGDHRPSKPTPASEPTPADEPTPAGDGCGLA